MLYLEQKCVSQQVVQRENQFASLFFQDPLPFGFKLQI
jgi:hypothetical protein